MLLKVLIYSNCFFTQDLVEFIKYFVEGFITIQQFLRKLYIFEVFSTFRLKFKYPGRKSSHSTVTDQGLNASTLKG
jgi:uncharacterized protein YqhQ